MGRYGWTITVKLDFYPWPAYWSRFAALVDDDYCIRSEGKIVGKVWPFRVHEDYEPYKLPIYRQWSRLKGEPVQSDGFILQPVKKYWIGIAEWCEEEAS